MKNCKYQNYKNLHFDLWTFFVKIEIKNYYIISEYFFQKKS